MVQNTQSKMHKSQNLCGKEGQNFQTSGSSILKDMAIFVFICIYSQIQKCPYILKYLSQRSENLPLWCTKCALCANFHLFWTMFYLFEAKKLLFNDPHNWPTVGGGGGSGLAQIAWSTFLLTGELFDFFTTWVLQGYYMGIVYDFPAVHWILIEQT